MARAKKAAAARPSGRVFLWNYPEGDKKSYGGWHLTGDAAGIASLLRGIDELASEAGNTTCVYPVAQPHEETLRHVHRKRRSGSPPDVCHTPRELVLRPATGGKPWKIREIGDRVDFAFDRVLIPMIRRQIERIGEGADDLGFGGAPGFEGWKQRLSLWRKPGDR